MSNNIEVNIKEVLKKLPDEKKAKSAMMSAFNRAVGPARTTAAKETSSRYHVTKQDVRNIDFVKRDRANTSITINWNAAQIPLDKFETTFPKTNHRFPERGRANSPQVTTMIRRGGRRVRYNTSFVAKTRAGNAVYRRTKKTRFPIKRVLGPAIPQLMNSLQLQEKIINRTQPIIDKRLEHEINRMLTK